MFLRVNVDAVSGAARGDDDTVVGALEPALHRGDAGACQWNRFDPGAGGGKRGELGTLVGGAADAVPGSGLFAPGVHAAAHQIAAG